MGQIYIYIGRERRGALSPFVLYLYEALASIGPFSPGSKGFHIKTQSLAPRSSSVVIYVWGGAASPIDFKKVNIYTL